MSDNETHYGKLKKIQRFENESFDDLCRRLWIEKGKSESEFYLIKGGSNALFDEFYNKYVKFKGELFEIIDHVESDDDYHCTISESNGLLNFHCHFYNGGTCLSEMLEDGLTDYFKNKEVKTYSIPKMYIGIHKNSKTSHGNFNKVFTECPDGLFRTLGSDIALSFEQIQSDEKNKFIKRIF